MNTARPRPLPAVMPHQVDGTTCGIAALAAVAARAGGPQHAYLNARRDAVDRIQVALHAQAVRVGIPWPQALGTSPWALASLASSAVGVRYGWTPWECGGVDWVQRAVNSGIDAFVYVGAHRLIPRHVIAVLAAESTDSQWVVFEPSSGKVITTSPSVFTQARAGHPRQEFGNWTLPSLVVAP